MSRITMASLMEDKKSLEEQVAKLTKELASSKSLQEYYSKQATEAAKEVTDLHNMLDCFPNPPSRKTTEDEEWKQTNLPVHARLVIWALNNK